MIKLIMKVYEADTNHFTRCRNVLFHKNKFHTFEEVTNSTLNLLQRKCD